MVPGTLLGFPRQGAGGRYRGQFAGASGGCGASAAMALLVLSGVVSLGLASSFPCFRQAGRCKSKHGSRDGILSTYGRLRPFFSTCGYGPVVRWFYSALDEFVHANKYANPLEHKNAQHHTNLHVDGDDLDHIDKSVVVVGGFNEKTMEEAEALVQQMMVGIAGYKSVEMIDGESPLGLATFDSPMQAMKFIRSQKKNGTIHTNKLWASENRSRTERARCKIVSKIKKYLIEVQGLAPANIIASYKTFRVVIRDQGKLVPVAFVGRNLGLEWLDAGSVGDGVREAMDAFIHDLE